MSVDVLHLLSSWWDVNLEFSLALPLATLSIDASAIS